MKTTTLSTLTLAAAALAVAACGGSSMDAGAASPEFQNAAPAYDSYGLQLTAADSAPPAALQAGSAQALTAAATAPDCHPHLFQHAHEVVARLNRHFYKHLHQVADLIEDHPRLKDGTTHVWEKVQDGVDRKLTITKVVNADGSVTYTFEVAAKQVAQASFVTLFNGTLTVTHASGSALAEEKGDATYNFDNLKIVYPAERATGTITDAFDRIHDPAKGGAHVKRTSTIAFHAFLPEENDPHGPRNGSYTWVSEPGIGGDFSFTDALVLACPSNPGNLVADVAAVSRWYQPAAGGMHVRSDAKATGGQIPAGDAFIGTTCAQSATTGSPAEGYWMMKLEDSTGVTVSGQATTDTSISCDAAFGPVPSVSNNATDYDFSAAVTFPGAW